MYAIRWGAKAIHTRSMRNGPEIIKKISGFIQYRKNLYEEAITKRVQVIHVPLIAYWDSIRSASKHVHLIQRFLTAKFIDNHGV